MTFNMPISDMYKFRKQDAGPYVNSVLEDQTSLDIYQCNAQWAGGSSIDKNIAYDEAISNLAGPVDFSVANWDTTNSPYLHLTQPERIVGIALNGVFIFSAINEYGYDAFYSRKYGNKRSPVNVTADICLGSVYQ
jgi:hypothetical protein